MKRRLSFVLVLLFGAVVALLWLPRGVPTTSASGPPECTSFGFAPLVAYPVAAPPWNIVTADLNSDAYLDLAVPIDMRGTVSILLGNGNGTFQPAVPYDAGRMVNSVAVGDFNADNKPDLAASLPYADPAGNSVYVSILMGNGDGSFQAPVTYTAGQRPGSVAVGDFNGDNELDLAVANNDSSDVSILLGNGDGTFQPPLSYAAGSEPRSLKVADFNGDGKLDLTVANFSSLTTSILLGNGDGTFQAAVPYSLASQPSSIAIGDFSADSKLDLAVSHGYFGSNFISVLLGNGDGTFGAAVTYAAGTVPHSIETADFNADSKLDLAVANDDGFSTVSILKGNGDGTFQAPVAFPAQISAASLVAGDFNGDMRPDLAVTVYSPNVAVMLNVCAQQTPIPTLTGTPFQATYTPTWTPTRTGTPFWGTATPDRTATALWRTPIPTPTRTVNPNQPVNDDFTNALAITSLPTIDTRDTTTATTGYNDPYCVSQNKTVWYRFTPATRTVIEANTFGSNYDTALSVSTYQWGYFNTIVCNDDSYSPPSQQSQVTFTADAGQTYYFMVAASTGNGGSLVFNAKIVPPPDNDDFAHALQITALPTVSTLNIAGATRAPDDPSDCGYGDLTVWYSYTPANNMRLTLDTAGSDGYPYVGVFTGSPGALSYVTCGYSSVQSFGATAGQTYYFMVLAPAGSISNLVLTVTGIPSPANDDFGHALQIASLPFVQTEDISAASRAADDPSYYCGSTDLTVWYSYTPATNMRLEMSISGGYINPSVSVYTGSRGALSYVTCGYSSVQSFGATAGQTYYFMVSDYNYGTSPNNVTLTVTGIPSPDNDDFDSARQIASLPFVKTEDMSGATRALDDPSYCGYGDLTVWYSYTPADNMRLEMSISGDNVYAPRWVGAFTGSRGDLSYVACAGSYPQRFDAVGGTTYYFMVTGSSNFTLTINGFLPPPNDDFAHALQIASLPYTDTNDISGASRAPDDPPYCGYGDLTVWYSYTPADNMRLEISITGGDGSPAVSAFTGAQGDLSYLTCAGSYPQRFDAVEGQTYYFMIVAYNYGTSPNNVTLTINGFVTPPNNDFNSALQITSLPYVDTRDLSAASRAADDPPPCNWRWEESHTVWYSYTPATNTRLDVDLSGSAGDPYVGVYTGSRGALSNIGCGSRDSLLRFDAVAGTTYYFMVESYDSDQGNTVSFALRLAPPPLAIHVTFDSLGTVTPPSGIVTLRGTVTCTQASNIEIWGDIQQKVGHGLVIGYPYASVYCDATRPVEWSSVVYSERGAPIGRGRAATLFTAGRAIVNIYSSASSVRGNEYANDTTGGTITLRPGR